MGYADGYYYGQGRIICDTSTFSVGDTIRVRSMTDTSKVWNQQVATVGTALVFTVPPYDYYKICTVQTIGGVATEVGGVYKTVDFGQTLFTNVLDKTTLQGVQNILNAHQEMDMLSVGDEVNITVNNADWTMQIANIDSSNHIIDFVSKEIYELSDMANGYNYKTSTLYSKMAQFYNLIHSKDKSLIKLRTKPSLNLSSSGTYTWQTFAEYVYPANCYEIFGTHNSGCPVTLTQFALFISQANRIKKFGGVDTEWWTCDGQLNYSSGGYINVAPNGIQSYTYQGNAQRGSVPCFRLTADS